MPTSALELSLEKAQRAAALAVELLKPACVRIFVAGSVRRRRPVVKDIELVAEPRFKQVFGARDLFGAGPARQVSELDLLIDRLHQSSGKIALGRLNGDRQKQLFVSLDSGKILEPIPVPIDLFIVRKPAQMGAILALRTGPVEFSKQLVTSCRFGGAMPFGMKQSGGALWKGETMLQTPSEEDWFTALGLPRWAPEERTEARLITWLAKHPVAPVRR